MKDVAAAGRLRCSCLWKPSPRVGCSCFACRKVWEIKSLLWCAPQPQALLALVEQGREGGGRNRGGGGTQPRAAEQGTWGRHGVVGVLRGWAGPPVAV